MARRRSVRAGVGSAMQVTFEADGIKETLAAFENLRGSAQRTAFRGAARKSVTKVKKTMKSLIPEGPGVRPNGQIRLHLRNALTTNVKVLGRGDNKYVSGIVGADYNEVPTIHLVNNPVKEHTIKAKREKMLSDLNVAGSKENATIFGKTVERPRTEGLGFMQQSAQANQNAIKSFYITAINKAVAKSRARK